MKKIVTISGGTGGFMLLSGLKKYPVQLSAIVNMVDNGGSSGILRDELGVLPPGDVRQCLVALSESSQTLRTLMSYRFENGNLQGHSFGNLLLSALEKINGNFSSAIESASHILSVKDEVIPVTTSKIHLYLRLSNGNILSGESAIKHDRTIQEIGTSSLYIEPKAMANPKAIKRIIEADLIVIGPGDFYCSILPNLLIKGIASAICRSKATVIFNCNITNRKGITRYFTLDDYVDTLHSFLGKERIDFVTMNKQTPPLSIIKKYEEQEESMVLFNVKQNLKRNFKVFKADLLSNKIFTYSQVDQIAKERAFIRHDSDKLAKLLMKILN